MCLFFKKKPACFQTCKQMIPYSRRQVSGHRKNKQKSLNYMFEADFCKCAQRWVCMPTLPPSVLQNLDCSSQGTLSCWSVWNRAFFRACDGIQKKPYFLAHVCVHTHICTSMPYGYNSSVLSLKMSHLTRQMQGTLRHEMHSRREQIRKTPNPTLW